ncbi:MAG: C1 family peptidase [Bacteroidetes bacterium]|nr:C1 family peptidase [Bacteroidota bacterium]
MHLLLKIIVAFSSVAIVHVGNTKLLAQELPATVDLRPYMSSVKDQGNRGACAFFASIGLVEAEIKRLTKQEVNLSEQYQINQTKRNNDEGSGQDESRVDLCFSSIKNDGVLYEQYMPYSPSYFEKGFPCYCMDKSAPGSRICYEQNPPDSQALKHVFYTGMKFLFRPATRAGMMETMANLKKPLLFHFPLFDHEVNNWPENGRIYYRSSLDSWLKKHNMERAYHFALICGYDTIKKEFLVKNSHGKSWGMDGYGTLSFADFDSFATRNVFFIVSKDTHLVLPPVPVEPKPGLRNFKVGSSVNSDRSISVHLQGKLQNPGRRKILVRSIVIAVPNGADPDTYSEQLKTLMLTAAEENFHRDKYVRAAYTYMPVNDNKVLQWKRKNPLSLTISAELMRTDSLQLAAFDTNRQMYLQTSLYLLDDEQGKIKMGRRFELLDRKKIQWKRGVD